MYDIIKTVINSGRYELSDMLTKIDTIWVQGDITEDQRSELTALAREKADPAGSYAPLQEQIDTLAAQVKSLSDRVTILEGGEPGPEPEEYPEYVQPTGAHDAYHAGDKVTYNGQRYLCTAPDGVAVVWSPETYPAYWQMVE